MIDNNINKLISMAERQSDQRLAQELNPQTETGLLGPVFISASELAYRQKIRDEAQAQPNQSPPIVQQLAQQATMSPVQPMPTAPMPMQQPMQPPMPMPQQPMQRFQVGGMVLGNPYNNLIAGQATDVMGNYPLSFDGTGRVVQDSMSPVQSNTVDDLVNKINKPTPTPTPTPTPVTDSTFERNIKQQEQLFFREPKANPYFGIGQAILDVGETVLDNPYLSPIRNLVSPDPKKLEEIKNSGIAATPNADQIDDGGVDGKGGKGVDGGVDGVNTLPTTGVSGSVTKDMVIGASVDYQNLINQSLERMTDEKGRMQNKWLRIAAGAFNAAQKGSPTLLGGLADLGAGVTEELVALNQEEQKQAQELFALFTAKQKLRLDGLKGQYDQQREDRTFQLDVNAKALQAYKDLKNADVTGGNRLTEEDLRTEVALSYADMGHQSSRQFMAREAKKILDEQRRLKELHGDDSSTALAEFDEFLSTTPHYRLIYENRLDRLTPGVNDWLVDLLASM